MVIGKLWNKKELLLWLWNHLRPRYAKSRELINKKTHDIPTSDRSSNLIYANPVKHILHSTLKKISKQIPTKHHTKSIYIDKDFLEEKCIKNNYKIEHNWLVVSPPLKKYARQNGKIFPNFPGGHAKYVETTAQKFFHHHSSLRKFRQFPLPLIPWAVFRCNAWDAKHSWMRGAKSTLERNKGLGRTTQLERVLKPKDWQLTKETFRDVESWRSWTVFFLCVGCVSGYFLVGFFFVGNLIDQLLIFWGEGNVTKYN